MSYGLKYMPESICRFLSSSSIILPWSVSSCSTEQGLFTYVLCTDVYNHKYSVFPI
jgi:hypothetical protein